MTKHLEHNEVVMNIEILNIADQMEVELTKWDVEQIKEKYFHLLHNGQGQINYRGIRSAITAYLQ